MKITFRFILCVFHASSVPSVVKQNVIYRKNDGKKVLKTAIVFITAENTEEAQRTQS